MAVIEVGEYKLDEYKLMQVRVKARGGVDQRLILPNTSWNTRGVFLLHDMSTGAITPVEDIIELLKQQGALEQCIIRES